MIGRRHARGLVAVLGALALGATLGVLHGCAGVGQKPQDAAHIETLRLKITKVRHALAETRETIARSQGAPYLPELYLRVAELVSEEARYHYRVAQEREQGGAEALHVPHVRLLKEQAIGLYEMLLRRFPGSPLAAQARFNMAYEHRELGDFDKMRAALQELVDKHADSPLRYEALLLLGDYHFDRNELPQAHHHYTPIARSNFLRLKGVAHYKLAWIAVNQGNCKRALGEFEKALEAERRSIRLAERRDRERARRRAEAERRKRAAAEQAAGAAREDASDDARGDDQELAQGEQPSEPESASDSAVDADTGEGESSEGDPFLDEGDDERAVDVRRSALVDLVYCYSQERPAERAVEYLRDRAHDRGAYVAALGKMARRFEVMGERTGARKVVRELLRLGPTDADRLDDARQMHSVLRAQKKPKAAGRDVALIAKALNGYLTRREVDAEQRAALSKEFEVYMRDALTRAQEGLPGGNARRDAARELWAGYRAYLETFPGVAQRRQMHLNAADLLVDAGMRFFAARQSLLAATLSDKRPEQQSALFAAIVQLQDSLRDDASIEDRDSRVLARATLRRAGRRLLSFPLTKDQQRRTRFAMAETLYQDGRYREAIDRLTALAYEFPGSPEASASIRLVLDSYNTVNDYHGLIQAAQRMLAQGSPAGPTLQQEIKQVLAQAEQRRLDEVSLSAAGDEGGDYGSLVKFARDNSGSSLGERALLNAFVAARAVGKTEQLYELGDEMAKGYGQSKELPGMLSTLGQMAVARFEVDRALSFLKQAADSGHPQKVQLLVAGGQLYQELGDYQTARQSYQQALSLGAGSPDPEPLERLAVLLEQTGNAQEVATGLSPYASSGNPEVLARLGLAQLALGQAEAAEGSLQGVLSGTGSPSPGALARAHFGMAELMRNTLLSYPALTDPTLIEEFITVSDVAQESYLNATREGSASYTTVALARLADTLTMVRARIQQAQLPGDLPPQAQQAIRAALDARIKQLDSTATEVLSACREQVWSLRAFGPTSRDCLGGKVMKEVRPRFDVVSRRASKPTPKRAGPLLERIGVNSEDLEALREFAEILLDDNQPHVARMVLQAAVEREGGPVEQNLLGIACLRAGKMDEALSAFAQAAEGGLEAARQNLAATLRKAGLSDAAKGALKRFPEGRKGGRRLGGR
ncbi:MAG: tetratricopeptide repeat protein [Myxococcales bacterium]|nr:tetratricopeptide repeat protein [Myxococcales bacterium]